jgi:hypothetical protein
MALRADVKRHRRPRAHVHRSTHRAEVSQESLWIGYWSGTADIPSSLLTALTAARLTGIHRKDAKL